MNTMKDDNNIRLDTAERVKAALLGYKDLYNPATGEYLCNYDGEGTIGQNDVPLYDPNLLQAIDSPDFDLYHPDDYADSTYLIDYPKHPGDFDNRDKVFERIASESSWIIVSPESIHAAINEALGKDVELPLTDEEVQALSEKAKKAIFPGPVQTEIPVGDLAPLPVDAIGFQDEIIELDGKLNFYIPVTFDCDAVFGTDVCTDANDDWLNIFVDYDMESGEVADHLDIDLNRGDGSIVYLTFPLDEAQRDALLPKMDAYCKYSTGKGLTECAKEIMDDLEPSVSLEAIAEECREASEALTSDGTTDDHGQEAR